MRHILFLLFMAFTLQAIAQYPATGNKMRLGWQTTGDGLVYRGAIGDTATLDPSGLNNAWMLLDTANGNLYAYRAKAWRLVSGGGGSVSDTLTGEVKGPLDSTYIDTVANIIFTTTTDTTVGVGELEYNDTQGSLIQGLKGGNVTNVIGQQIHQRVTNTTGGPLTKGTAVFLHGSQGNRITVRKALATADSTSANTFGIVAESIADNQSGYVITEGLITNMNTNALTEGAAVYLSPTVAGELTTTKPQAPQHTVYIGVCVKQHTGSGELFVKIRNGQELDELHDVRIDSPTSNASLYYNSSESVWRDTTAAALKSDISGTANYLAKFTGANTIGNSGFIENGQEVYLGGTTNAFNASRFSIYYNPVNNGFPIVADTRAYNSAILPGAGWNFGGKKDSTGAYTAFGAIQGAKETSANSEAGYLQFSTNGDGGSAFPEERMRITSNGLVGIRNPTPVNILDVGHPTNSPLTNATVGINSTSSGGTTKVAFENGTSVKGDVLTTSNATVIGTGGMAIQTTTNHPIIFRTNSSGVESGGNERMRILEGGNVGIATSSPSRPLHVNANSSMIIPSGATGTRPASGADGDLRYSTTFSNIEFYRTNRWIRPLVGTVANSKVAFASGDTLTSNTNFHWDNTNTRLGIGNAAPDSTLTVTGGIRATRDIYARRLNVSTITGQVVSINNYAPAGSPGNNLWIGNGGQLSTWASGNQGSNNIGIGFGALAANTSGSDNVANGVLALEKNTMGIGNIANGRGALNANTIGNSNVANGVFSLLSNISGTGNVANGGSALQSNITGDNNIANGTGALNANTAGSGNVANGFYALVGNITGDANVANGASALFSNTSGYENIADGSAALYFNTTGYHNVGIGRFAGAYTNAGAANQSSNSSIYIGYDARSSASGNSSEIVIGSQALGNGSNTTTIGNSSTTNTVIPAGSLTVDVMRRKAPVTVTGNHTVAASTSWLICDGTATIFLTLPTASSWTGREIMVKTIQPQAVNSAANDVVPIDGVAAVAGILPATDGAWCTIVSDGTNWIIMQRGN